MPKNDRTPRLCRYCANPVMRPGSFLCYSCAGYFGPMHPNYPDPVMTGGILKGHTFRRLRDFDVPTFAELDALIIGAKLTGPVFTPNGD